MESRGHIHETSEGFSGSEQGDVKETPQNDGLVSPNYNAITIIKVLFTWKESQTSPKSESK